MDQITSLTQTKAPSGESRGGRSLDRVRKLRRWIRTRSHGRSHGRSMAGHHIDHMDDGSGHTSDHLGVGDRMGDQTVCHSPAGIVNNVGATCEVNANAIFRYE